MRPLLVELLAGDLPSGLAHLVPSAAVMYAVAVGALALLFLRRAGPLVGEAAAIRCALGAFVFGVVGARAFYLLFVSADAPQIAPETWLSTTGTASWGAYIGAVAGLLLCRDRGAAPALAYLDVAASCAPVGIALGRIGCLLNGDDFGRVAALPWAVHYPAGSYPYAAHLAEGLIPPQATVSLPTHPLQLYFAVAAMLTFSILSAVYRRRQVQPGITLAAFLLIDGSCRFLLEFLRAPAAGGSDIGLSLSQTMALLGMCLGGLVYASTRRTAVKVAAMPNQVRHEAFTLSD
jgi:phosphatidylglycerol:prolipoprotein diacylglycerol transferase